MFLSNKNLFLHTVTKGLNDLSMPNFIVCYVLLVYVEFEEKKYVSPATYAWTCPPSRKSFKNSLSFVHNSFFIFIALQSLGSKPVYCNNF